MKALAQSKAMGFVSDIHGNAAALNAVLAELGDRLVTELYAAGDHVYGGEQPLEVWRLLEQLKARCTQGASDLALGTLQGSQMRVGSAEEATKLELFRLTQQRVGELVLATLRKLPRTCRVALSNGAELLMCHGAPRDMHQALSHDLSDDELLSFIDDDPADIVVCGASHVPFDRTIGNVRVINVGSVGQAPEGQIAHFTIVTPRMDHIEVEQSWVEY